MNDENMARFANWTTDVDPQDSVSVTGVSKHFNGFYAVKDVSFSLAKGEFLTLLGPSGSGKTTMLMMVAGFAAPSEGRIEVMGRDVVNLPPQKRSFGIVFQGYALFPHKSALQNVEFPLKMRGVPRAERRKVAGEMLERVGLGQMVDRKPREMSGGQQQRVALARALVFKPDALLLDEPLGALDKNMREKMQYEIKELQKSLGISVLFVTHDQEEAMSMSDRIAVMNNGRIVQIGSPSDVYKRPQTKFVANFLGETNMLPCMIEAIEKESAKVALHNNPTSRAMIMWPAAAYNVGKDATLSIRPEKARLLGRDEVAECSVSGRLLHHTFLGRLSRSVVMVHGREFNVISQADGMDVFPHQGDEVRVGWSYRDAQLLLE